MTTRGTHTPGPWRVDNRDGDPRIRCERYCIALVTGGLDDDGEVEPVRYANAHLIAAAPELLKALKQIVEHEQIDGTGIRYTFDWHSPFGQAARAAIAKAEGSTPTP